MTYHDKCCVTYCEICHIAPHVCNMLYSRTFQRGQELGPYVFNGFEKKKEEIKKKKEEIEKKKE